MKRLILLYIVLVFCISYLSSQPRNSYISVGYVKSELSKKGEDPLNSRYGLSLSAGYTHFLNKEPLLGSVYLGIDWTFLYGSFRQYRIQLEDHIEQSALRAYRYKKDLKEDMEIDHSAIGMQFGPSITYLPIKDLQISGYFRYAPTLGFLETAVDPYNPPSSDRLESYEEKADFSYVGYYSIGLSVSYKIYMLGIEHKWATLSHRVRTSDGPQTIKFNTSGTWFNIGVRLGKSAANNKKKNYTYSDELSHTY